MKKVTDYAKKYRDMGYTCAESTLLAANEAWDLGLKEEDTHVMAGFGGGFHAGSVCGAVSGAIAALSIKYFGINGHQSPLLALKCRLLFEAVNERLGTCTCRGLAPIYRNLKENCTPTVWEVTRILDEIEELDLSAVPVSIDYDARFVPEGKPSQKELFARCQPQIDAFKARSAKIAEEKKAAGLWPREQDREYDAFFVPKK